MYAYKGVLPLLPSVLPSVYQLLVKAFFIIDQYTNTAPPTLSIIVGLLLLFSSMNKILVLEEHGAELVYHQGQG